MDQTRSTSGFPGSTANGSQAEERADAHGKGMLGTKRPSTGTLFEQDELVTNSARARRDWESGNNL